jgi:hypothetical protein
VPRSTAPRSRSGLSKGTRTAKGTRVKGGKAAKGRRRSRSGRAFRVALLVVVLVAAGVVVTWPAAEKHLTALPYLDSVIAALAPPSPPAWPLTGIPADAIADRPALAVKIRTPSTPARRPV